MGRDVGILVALGQVRLPMRKRAFTPRALHFLLDAHRLSHTHTRRLKRDTQRYHFYKELFVGSEQIIILIMTIAIWSIPHH